MELDEYQKLAIRTKVFKIHTEDHVQTPELSRHYLLSGLMSQIGEVANRLKKKLRDGDDYELLSTEISERLGYSMWYIAILADELGLSLSEIASENAAFNERRWHQMTDTEQLFPKYDFDSNYPNDQQLPESIMINFETSQLNGINKTKIFLYPEWPNTDIKEQFGDEIDDNSTQEDSYRFHDIFHFSYLAYLSWSPVVRKLLNRKRRQDPNVDRIEDGARARDTEEAATAFIYSYVSAQQFLGTSDNVDTSVLTTVRTLLRAYEVRTCAEKEWEIAILQACKALRELIANNGGWVKVDRKNKNIHYLGPEIPPP